MIATPLTLPTMVTATWKFPVPFEKIELSCRVKLFGQRRLSIRPSLNEVEDLMTK
jgi:hypothetical protein